MRCTRPVILLLALSGLMTGCASQFVPLKPAIGLSSMEDDFTQQIEGTALSFEMTFVPSRDTPGNGADESLGGFWVSKMEISWEVFDVFVYRLDGSSEDSTDEVDAITRPSKPYIAMDRGFGHAGYPALSMSFHGARQFCHWLSLKTGRTYRLPTEQEWTSLCNQSGINEDNADQYAWLRNNATFKTHKTGSKKADALGLHDLWGNASEWCITNDGTGVTMGGTYRDPIEGIGCAMRAEPQRAWNASDPQFPKSIWWLADAGFVGMRIVCDKK